jgi:hypothetical protein
VGQLTEVVYLKLRTGFVTNSSSSSFGIAGPEVIASLGILGAFFGMTCRAPAPKPPDTTGTPETDVTGVKDSEMDAILAASEQASKEAADNLAADAAKRDDIASALLNTQEGQLNAQADKIKAEMDAYDKQWQDAKQGVDPKDPGYADFKKKYDDYQDYLKGQLDDVGAQINEIHAAQIQEQIAKDSKNDWIKQRQEDLVQVSEQKAFLEAVAKGYGGHEGYNVDEVNARLKQLNEREGELRGVLKENDAEINYTPKQRDPIGPDPAMEKMQAEYRAKQQALQQEINAAQVQRKAEKLADLKKEQAWLEKDAANKANKAAFWNFMTKSAEVTQVGADIGVDILSKVTGPAGQTIKTAYTGLKGVAGGVGEGLANGDMSKNVLKGAVGGLSDIIKDKVGGDYVKGKLGETGTKIAQGAYTIGSEAGKGALEAGLDGKDIVDGAIGGAAKGTIDVGVSAGFDKLLPPKDLPSGMDWTDANVKDAYKYLKGGNPLTNSPTRSLWQGAGSTTGISRTAVSEGLISAGKDQAKGFIKGDEVPVLGTKQEFTSQAIQSATPYIKSGGAAAISGAKSLAGALKNSVSDPGSVVRA